MAELLLVSAAMFVLGCWATVMAWGTFRFDHLPAAMRRNIGVRIAVEAMCFPFVAVILWIVFAFCATYGFGGQISDDLTFALFLVFAFDLIAGLTFTLFSAFTRLSPIRRAEKRLGASS